MSIKKTGQLSVSTSAKADLFGNALTDYYNAARWEDIVVHSSIAEDDVIPLPYLFRDFKDMPPWEQKALNYAKGNILDVGACAGSHSLYLQKKGLDVTALDQSPGAIEIIKKRGVKQVICSPLLSYHAEKFDTILLLMNGTGIFERIDSVDEYLQHLKTLLKPGGQILLDSTDIHYMFEEEDGSYWLDAHRDYYGEVTFAISYKNQRSAPFDWLYLDFTTLSQYAKKIGFKISLLEEGPNFEYLARLVKD